MKIVVILLCYPIKILICSLCNIKALTMVGTQKNLYSRITQKNSIWNEILKCTSQYMAIQSEYEQKNYLKQCYTQEV